MPDNRVNLQSNQPGIEGQRLSDENGWPSPLTDPSSPLKVAVTNGSNGSQKNFDPVSTSRQNELSLAEGSSSAKTGDMAEQGGHGNKEKTSQQNISDHSGTDLQ